MVESTAHRDGHLKGLALRNGLLVEIVKERAVRVVLCDKPQLCHSVIRDHIAGKEPEDVVVSKENRVVDLRLSEPRLVVARRKFLDGNVLALVVTDKDLAKATTADRLTDDDSPCDGPLDQKGESGATSRRARQIVQVGELGNIDRV